MKFNEAHTICDWFTNFQNLASLPIFELKSMNIWVSSWRYIQICSKSIPLSHSLYIQTYALCFVLLCSSHFFSDVFTYHTYNKTIIIVWKHRPQMEWRNTISVDVWRTQNFYLTILPSCWNILCICVCISTYIVCVCVWMLPMEWKSFRYRKNFNIYCLLKIDVCSVVWLLNHFALFFSFARYRPFTFTIQNSVND